MIMVKKYLHSLPVNYVKQHSQNRSIKFSKRT